MHQKSSKQRLSSRIPIALSVRMKTPDGAVTALHTENVSDSGLLLRCAKLVPPDQRIELFITLPGQEQELHATAQARFVGPAEGGFAIGVQITDMPAADRERWQRFYEGLPGVAVSAESSTTSAVAVRSNANILLVSSALSPAMLEAMVANGYHVNVVRDPLEGTRLLRQRQDFEIVISEVRRRDLDGRALCNLIKQNRALRDVHVILLAEHDSEKDLLDGLDAGATYVVAKPFTEEFFLSLITLCQGG